MRYLLNIFFWIYVQWCKFVILFLVMTEPDFREKNFWAYFSLKLPEMSLFWTLCEVHLIVFFEFSHKIKQRAKFSEKWPKWFFPELFFGLTKNLFVFGEIFFCHFYGKWAFLAIGLVFFLAFISQWCKMVIPNVLRSTWFWKKLGKLARKVCKLFLSLISFQLY